MRHVAPVSHEWTANYLYDAYDLAPFFAFDSAVKEGGGSRKGKFTRDGETWEVTLSYQNSGLKHPGPFLPSGTKFELETIREFRLSVERAEEEDDPGQQSFGAHIAPRWKGMKSKGRGANPTVPNGIDEAINVKITGSNIEFGRYPYLLMKAVEAVGVAGYYVEPRHVHDYSNVQDAARYVRVEDEVAGTIHARDGPIVGLAHVLESDRSGYRKLVQNDTDGRGRDVPGYYHTVTLGPKRIQEAWPHHSIPKEVKHYYAREAAGMGDEALAHPKLEASYQTSRWDETLHPVDDLEQLAEELDEVLLSVLADAGISLRPREPGGGDGEADTFPYKPDGYFAAEEHDVGRRLVELNLTQIESSQESVVIKHVADGLSPVEWGTLETLVTDGGEVSPDDVAEREGFHIDSVYRALDRLEKLVEHNYGSISLRSEHIAKYVYEAVEEGRRGVQRAFEASAKAMEAAERGVDETTSAFIAFCARHGIDVDDRTDARMKLRLGGVENPYHAVREAWRLWKRTGADPTRFRQAQLDFGDGGKADAWRYLPTG